MKVKKVARRGIMAIQQWVPVTQIEDVTDPQVEEEADIEVEEGTTYALLHGIFP